jgi:hypothetical protein
MRAFADELEEVAGREQVPVATLAAAHRAGEALIVRSRRGVRPVGIGKHLRAKFACIVGTSTAEPDMAAVLRKAQIAVDQGAAVIHNGSAGGNVREMQRRLLDAVAAPLAVCHPIGVMADACYRQESFIDLKQNLRDNGLELGKMPLVIQFNKRDLPNIRSDEELARLASKGKEPVFKAIATQGSGVVETFVGLLFLTFRTLDKTHELSRRLGINGEELVKSAAQQLGVVTPIDELLGKKMGGNFDGARTAT